MESKCSYGTLRCTTAPPARRNITNQKETRTGNPNCISRATIERLAIPKYSNRYSKQDQLRCSSATSRFQQSKIKPTFPGSYDYRAMTGTFEIMKEEDILHIKDDLRELR